MARNRRREPDPFPRINQYQKRGLDKSQIVAKLTGTRNNSGGASRLGANQLREIGFGEGFIKNALGKKYSAPRTSSGGGRAGGDRPSNGGRNEPGSPYEEDPGFEEDYGDGGGFEEPGSGIDVESAYTLFASMLNSWGIPVGSDMADIIRTAVQDGIGPDQIDLIVPYLQATDTWKKRFSGWEKRVANGYNQVSVGEYLALESAYHRILQANGLPSGFYDDPSDFGEWIANNVSPDEIQERVGNAMNLVRQVDPTAKGLLTQFYGVADGDLAAYFLDPKRALPTLQRQYEAVNVAAFAKKAGLNTMNSQHWEELVDKGVTAEAAAQGMATVGQFYRTLGNLGEVHGIQYTQGDAEADVFFNDNEKRRKIVQREVAAFSGRSGFQGGVSGSGSTAGSY